MVARLEPSFLRTIMTSIGAKPYKRFDRAGDEVGMFVLRDRAVETRGTSIGERERTNHNGLISVRQFGGATPGPTFGFQDASTREKRKCFRPRTNGYPLLQRQTIKVSVFLLYNMSRQEQHRRQERH